MNNAKAIIIEGVDGSGKSTLARRMSSAIGWQVIHMGGAPSSIPEDEIRVAKSIRVMTGERVLMDRAGFISAALYGPILWDDPAITQDEALQVIRRYKPTIFYCRPNMGHEQDIIDRHAKKSYDTPDYVRKISENAGYLVCQYDRFMTIAGKLTDVIHVSEAIYGK
ncbi:hypothetical protein KAR91_04595 [Candidatus Pacearchaeota archaeon]|nr:hypothetical protein [Candidatus Pacearchaeota archaeon]